MWESRKSPDLLLKKSAQRLLALSGLFALLRLFLLSGIVFNPAAVKRVSKNLFKNNVKKPCISKRFTSENFSVKKLLFFNTLETFSSHLTGLLPNIK
jgi:hypothetical protein